MSGYTHTSSSHPYSHNDDIRAIYSSGYGISSFNAYNNLMETCTILNPNRKPFVKLRTVNDAAKTHWEREVR